MGGTVMDFFFFLHLDQYPSFFKVNRFEATDSKLKLILIFQQGHDPKTHISTGWNGKNTMTFMPCTFLFFSLFFYPNILVILFLCSKYVSDVKQVNYTNTSAHSVPPECYFNYLANFVWSLLVMNLQKKKKKNMPTKELKMTF